MKPLNLGSDPLRIQFNPRTGKFRLAGAWCDWPREYRSYRKAKRALDKLKQDEFVREGWEDVE